MADKNKFKNIKVTKGKKKIKRNEKKYSKKDKGKIRIK